MRSSSRFVHARAARWAGGAAFAVSALSLCRCSDSFNPSTEGPADAGAEASVDAQVYVVAAPDAEARDAGADAENESDAGTDAAPVPCDPTQDPKDNPCVIDDALAVFVAASVAGDAGSADGSKAHPVVTIGQGLALAAAQQKSRVYVCNGKYVESVDVESPVSLYGGFACSAGANGPAWSWVGGTADVTAPSGVNAASPSSPTYALLVHTSSPALVTVADMTLSAPDAVGTDAQGNGASSIAAFVNGSSATFTRVALAAGQGARGANGVTGVRNPDGTLSPSNYSAVAPPAATAAGPGVNVCNFIDIDTGATMTDRSSGGVGGLGSFSAATGLVAADGYMGTSYPPPLPGNPLFIVGNDGLGGAGGISGATGHPGQPGPARPGGVAAIQSGWLGPTGWIPSPGGDGPAGHPGEGGGGGGGTGNEDQGFVAGGGGGAGGCGGAGGTGGGGGGASVALLSFASQVTLTSCVLRSARSGDGGAGGPGQVGQVGGSGLPIGMSPGPGSGGGGGAGAGGSGGAGGSAGVSAGILYNPYLPAFNSVDTSFVFGPVGVAGLGGAAGPFVANFRNSAAGTQGAVGYVDPQGWGAFILAP